MEGYAGGGNHTSHYSIPLFQILIPHSSSELLLHGPVLFMPNFYLKAISVERLNVTDSAIFCLSCLCTHPTASSLCSAQKIGANVTEKSTHFCSKTVSIISYSKTLGHTCTASLPSLARAHAGRFCQLATVLLKDFWISSKILSPHRTRQTHTSERLNRTGTVGKRRKRSPQRRGSCWWVWWQCLPETLMQRNDHRA